MARGFMGKMLWVDLSKKGLKDEALNEKLGRDFFGGYGLGARILFSRQEAGAQMILLEAIHPEEGGYITKNSAFPYSPSAQGCNATCNL